MTTTWAAVFVASWLIGAPILVSWAWNRGKDLGYKLGYKQGAEAEHRAWAEQAPF